MALLTSPERVVLTASDRVVFLAGSIEMGKAEDWQRRLAAALLNAEPSLVVANPRRNEWNPSWEQRADNPPFREQVDWELDHLERADLAVFYFQPDTLSPITLMELGMRLSQARRGQVLVCCPEGFWRRGNVEIACLRAGLPPPLPTWEALEHHALEWARSP